jgi:CDP-diacylglycerol--serine O-phosphatidyltransferase
MVVMITTIYIDGPFYTDNFASHVHSQLLNWGNAVFYGVPNSMDASIKYLPFTALFIPFMSMFRLAKFNLDKRQTDSFIGLPTPLNTVFFTFFPLTLWQEFDVWKFDEGIIGYIFNSYFLVAVIIIMSLLLVAEIPLFSLKFKHFKWKGNEIRYIFLISCSILIASLLVWSIPIIVFLQLILSIIDTKLKNETNEIQS